MPGAYVMFHADKGGLSASALTDDTGTFVAKTYFSSGQEQRNGMVAGEYRVTVTKQDVESIKSTHSPPKNLLPKTYATPESSPLSAVVEASSDNSYDFILN